MTVSDKRSHVTRGRNSANSSLGYLPESMSSTDSSSGRVRVAWGCAANEVVDVTNRPVVECAHRHDLLGEDVERVGRQVERLDGAGAHPLGDNGGLDEVTAELREEHSVTHGADLVTGSPHSLQPARHRGR